MSANTKTTKDDVVLGSGDLWLLDDKDGTMQDLEIGTQAFYDALEVPANQIGHIQGGASLEYSNEWKKVKDDYQVIVKQFLTSEEVKMKGGILAWNGEVLSMLCATARSYEEDSDGIKLYKFGGTKNANGKVYFIHFRHKRDDGTYIRVTIKGICENGFTLAFDPENETVLDPEFSAQGNTDDNGTLVYYSEQKPQLQCATPIASPAAGAVASGTSVTLTTATTNADIYYTVDGSTPTITSTKYTTAISVSSAITIKAIAVKTGMNASTVMEATYSILECATPTATPAAGAVASGTTITLATTTQGAEIYYTLDGTEPTSSSTQYSTPIAITEAKTIKAIAIKTGYDNSSVLSSAYTIQA